MTFRVSWFLLLVGVWNCVIWPNFMYNIAKDPRSWSGGEPTGFFLVHLVLVVVNVAIGLALLVLGLHGIRAKARASESGEQVRG
ncbi:hypothetical protein C3Y87_02870 [Carbonactinospora thermoautotrophica]|uniref:SCO4848 family membrane protein n=1 Tax=Carbonactinospora thermoautotrophica TaxID=1469144 RepID=UPI0022708A8E|nr:hypothetical protein [Carbonactinospora thermoautotrophica]MCX9190374.1 hypothetical protein [Carbonactinospora thermoautotrophica]